MRPCARGSEATRKSGWGNAAGCLGAGGESTGMGLRRGREEDGGGVGRRRRTEEKGGGCRRAGVLGLGLGKAGVGVGGGVLCDGI